MKSKNEMNCLNGKLIFLLVLILFLTVANVSAIRITGERFITTATTATITWTTDEASTSVVHYGLGNTNQTKENITLTRNHQIFIENLRPNSIYDARLESNTDVSSRTKVGLSFITKRRDVIPGGSGNGSGAGSGNITNVTIITSIPTVDNLFNLPPAVPAEEITIEGFVNPNSRVKFYVNTVSIPSQIHETGNFSVVADENGSFVGTISLQGLIYNGVLGLNNITIEIKDSQNIIQRINKLVIVDIGVPPVEIDPIPQYNHLGIVIINGKIHEEGFIFFTLENPYDSNGTINVDTINLNEISVNEFGEFHAEVPLEEGEHTLYIIVEDVAGNRQVIEYEVDVDTVPCTVEWEPESIAIINGIHHFNFVKLKGRTINAETDEVEAGCEVEAVNFGTAENFNDLPNTEINEHVRLQSLRAGVSGIASSFTSKVTSGDNGNFELGIVLTSDIDYTLLEQNGVYFTGQQLQPTSSGTGGYGSPVTVNNFLLRTKDRAGNVFRGDSFSITYEPGSSNWHLGKIYTVPNTVYSNNLIAEVSTGTTISVIYDLYYVGPNLNVKNAKAMAIVDTSASGLEYGNFITPYSTNSIFYPEQNRLFVVTKLNINPNVENVNQLLELLGEDVDDDDNELGTGLDMKFNLIATVTYNVEGFPTPPEDVFIQHSVGLETPFDYTKFLTPELIEDTLDDIQTIKEVLATATEYAEYATYGTMALCGVMAGYNIFSGEGAADMKKTYAVCDRVWCPTIPADCTGIKRSGTGENVYYEQSMGNRVVTSRFIPGQQALGYQGIGVNCYGSNVILINEVETDATYGSNIFGNRAQGYLGRTSPVYESGNVRYQCTSLSQEGFNTLDQSAMTSGILGCYAPGPPEYHETKCWPDSADIVNNNGEVNPYDDILISARCGCITGVRGHLSNFLRITEGVEKCLEQARIGEVRGGYCERLIGQFVCDGIAWGVKKAIKGGFDFSSNEGGVGRNNANEVMNRLGSRYGNIIQNQYGLSSTEIVHKACVGAITGDWSDFENVITTAARVPVAPVIGPIIPESRFQSYDPFTGRASINYYSTLGIMSGGQRVIGTFTIYCDSAKPNGEYCPSGQRQIIYQESFVVEPSQSLQENLQFTDPNARWWGNVAVLEVKYELGDQPQVTKVVEEKIYHHGALLEQCGWNMYPPQIYCQTVFGGNRAVQFKDAKISPATTVFYPGQNVLIEADFDIAGVDVAGASEPYPGSTILIAMDSRGAFGGEQTSQNPGSQSQGTVPALTDNPKMYLVYDLARPDGQIISNRNDPQKLEQFEVKFEQGENKYIFNLIEIPSSVVAVTQNSVFAQDRVSLPVFGFSSDDLNKIGILKKNNPLTFEAGFETPSATLGGQISFANRNIKRMKLHDSSNNEIVCAKADGEYKIICTNSGNNDFIVSAISFEIDIYAGDVQIKFKASNSQTGNSPAKSGNFQINQQTQTSLSSIPPGNYRATLTLYEEDGNRIINTADRTVPYGDAASQSKEISFTIESQKPQASVCNSATGGEPKISIIYPKQNSYITDSLRTIRGVNPVSGLSEYRDGVYFTVWDDCSSAADLKFRLFDSNTYESAKRENPQNIDLAKITDTTETVGNIPMFRRMTGNTKTAYYDGQRYELIVEAVDKDNKRGEARVSVIGRIDGR